MAMSNSILAYLDCKEFFEKAMEDEKGARRPFQGPYAEDHASRYRMRCHQFRKLDREQNSEIYEVGHQMHGRSEYDLLTLTLRYSSDAVWVYAEKLLLDPGEIESLSGVPEITPEERQLLEKSDDGIETSS